MGATVERMKIPAEDITRVESGARLLQLDFLRGIAILLVLMKHSSGLWPAAWPSGPLKYFFVPAYYLGPTGVDLFFVLSGFLVGGLLLKQFSKTSSPDFNRFIIRRGLKIWPPYFVFLLYVFIFLMASGDGIRTAGLRLRPNLLHIQNYVGSPREQTWSLAVEEHFYILLPLGLWMLTRRTGIGGLKSIPMIAAFLFTVCTLMRYIAYAHPQKFNPYSATHLRLDALFFGVLLAYLHRFNPHLLAFAKRRQTFLLLGGCLMLTGFLVWLVRSTRPPWGIALSFPLIYFAYGAILLAILYTEPGKGWLGYVLKSGFGRVVAWAGIYSYSIYLWHLDVALPLEVLVRRGGLAGFSRELQWPIGSALYLAVACGVGALLSILIERPSLMLRERLFPDRGPAVRP
jgi:peptidoglycan/LPS O-acetylase OafA/YrhL